MVDFDKDMERAAMLKERLETKKMTQVQLAEAIGVAQPTVSRWLTGKEPVPESRYEALCSILDINMEAMIDGCEHVRSTEQIERWRLDVMSNTPSRSAMVVLMTFPAFMRPSGEVHVVEEDVAALIPSFEVEDVRDAWESVLNSPFVKRVGRARWVFHLQFDESTKRDV